MRTIIDYSVTAAANITEKSLRKITSLERACLIYAIKSLPQVDTDVLNVITNTMPIDLHLKFVCAKKFIVTQSKLTPSGNMLWT